MPDDATKFYLTTAIDYPNSRPHIGTAFEKIGADVQARYRRMQGYRVHFLMGNDENTIKVARRAAELKQDVQAYCNDMARQFQEVWRALDISFDDFIQTSEPRHHTGCQKFIQKVFDNGYIYKGNYDGLYCDGCEAFKTETEVKEAGGVCPIHKKPVVRRSEPCYFFALSRFRDRLLKFYDEHPEFIQPETRRNEVISLVKGELRDVNITRTGEEWGIRVPFDPEFTIYVWFDALLNYITAIGYGSDTLLYQQWWPAEMHFIGKDITRFHCALWPAMLWAAGEQEPRSVFGHGFVYIKNEETGAVDKISKSLGNAVEPMEIVTKFSSDAFRYYFMRECPFPGDGEFSWQRFADVYNSELANNLGNLYSRCVTLITKNFNGELQGTKGTRPDDLTILLPRTVRQGGVNPGDGSVQYTQHFPARIDIAEEAKKVRHHIEQCQYNQALITAISGVLTPTNQYLENHAPWKTVKTDKDAAKHVLFSAVQYLRVASILLKPFIPRSTETIYRSFNFGMRWDEVRYEDAAVLNSQTENLRVVAQLEGGKVKPLFPRIG
jgi:methionyl-tRNA synthetase